MRNRRRRLLAAALVAVALTAGVSCGSDDSTAEGGDATTTVTPSAEATAAALAVCGVVAGFAGVVADEVNAASRQITLETDPDEARRLLLDATEAIRNANAELPDRYAELGLPEDGDIGRLVDDAAATDEAVAEQLDAISAELADGLEGEGAREILSATFIAMEKVRSLSQPDQGDYSDAALVAALDTEPACEHTISR